MMKKKYMAPEATTLEFASEGVFAASLDYGDKTSNKKVTDENQVLSNKGGWNSSLWSEME